MSATQKKEYIVAQCRPRRGATKRSAAGTATCTYAQALRHSRKHAFFTPSRDMAQSNSDTGLQSVVPMRRLCAAWQLRSSPRSLADAHNTSIC